MRPAPLLSEMIRRRVYEARRDAARRGATKEGQWVLRTPLRIRTLAALCSARF